MTNRIGRALQGLWLCAALLWPAAARAALEIRQVSAAPLSFDPARGESTAIRFELSEPAQVALEIYDVRGLEVRRIAQSETLPAGAHELRWDGRDERGRSVPAEAYVYTLAATGAAGASALWDLADRTGGETLRAEAVHWDPQAGEIDYILPERGRARIRIGLEDDGPLLATVIDWVPRPAGPQHTPWNGKDASGVLDLAHHPKLAISVEAFALPQNALLVGPPPARVEFIADLAQATPRRRAEASGPRHMHDFAHLPAETRGDFPLDLELPATLPHDESGRPLVAEAIPVKIQVAPEVATHLLEQRFEAVFFVDGLHAFENESAFFPLTWRWDPRGLSPGIHYLSANLRGYEGQFGLATRAVVIAPPPAGAQPTPPPPGPARP
jgi:hypothetical protein